MATGTVGIRGLKQLSEEGPSQVTATPSVAPGTIMYHGGDTYQYCFNASADKPAPVGIGVILKTASTGYSVTITSTSGVTPAFGYVKNTAITTAAYGWVLKQGFTPMLAGTTDLAVSNQVVLGADGVTTRVTGATGYKAAVHGYVSEAAASAVAGYGYVNCL